MWNLKILLIWGYFNILGWGRKILKNRVELDIILQFLFDRYFDSSGGRAGGEGERGARDQIPYLRQTRLRVFNF